MPETPREAVVAAIAVGHHVFKAAGATDVSRCSHARCHEQLCATGRGGIEVMSQLAGIVDKYATRLCVVTPNFAPGTLHTGGSIPKQQLFHEKIRVSC